MGSSETGVVVDCSVGSIVWVRRRNGSWWPGKILGPEELSSSLITSPRSGTPVKLLGREDASVDWYNLEKSKRVKAFRCGEFNDCIERAEAAHGMPPKKREKYARREDAILHAIELERQLVEKKYGKSGNSSIGLRKSPDAVTSSECMEIGGNQKDPISDQLTEKLGSTVAEKNGTDQCPCGAAVKEENKPNGDDDSDGALPRMRGLQDFGLQITPTREENPGAAPRAKRSRNSYLAYDSGDCSNDNITLTTQIEIPVSKLEDSSYQAEMGEDHNSGSTEDTETDCSETDSMESDSDEEMADLSDGSASIELHPKYPRSIEAQEEHVSISSSDDFDDMAYADGLSHSSPHGYASNSTGVSKWPLKGKRNNRNVGKRYPDRSDAEVSKGYINNINPNSGFKADLTGLRSSNEAADMDTFTWNNQSVMRGYWEDSQDYADLFFSGRHLIGGRAMLIDVDLKVQANNYRRDVPMISLMSKLNGHAIVGHPIQIEALESGVFENHVYFHPEPLAVWRTGRRTANSRVPRPFLNGENNRRLSRNSANRGSGPSSQKVRTLSSFASDKQHEIDPRNGASGVIKTGNLPTTVACIPVNLVFSRLNEELHQ